MRLRVLLGGSRRSVRGLRAVAEGAPGGGARGLCAVVAPGAPEGGAPVWREGVFGSKRTRQHVNPLSEKYQQSASIPEDWLRLAFADPTLPLHIDIGCARGTFCMDYAALHDGRKNVLGVEIREVLVTHANEHVRQAGITNLNYMWLNANVGLKQVLASLPAELPLSASIFFPDPWFKKKHHKRRVVQAQLVDELAAALHPSGRLLVQVRLGPLPLQSCTRQCMRGLRSYQTITSHSRR
jgi:tRNA (guanine-N7-)-methyltransferase